MIPQASGARQKSLADVRQAVTKRQSFQVACRSRQGWEEIASLIADVPDGSSTHPRRHLKVCRSLCAFDEFAVVFAATWCGVPQLAVCILDVAKIDWNILRHTSDEKLQSLYCH